MNPIFIPLILITILQGFYCGFGLIIILALIGRLCYAGRSFGRPTKTKTCRRFEYASIIWILFKFIAVHGAKFDWKTFLLSVSCSAIVIFIEHYDDSNYSYYTDTILDEDEDMKDI